MPRDIPAKIIDTFPNHPKALVEVLLVADVTTTGFPLYF
jgi:hypothetical protein